MITFYQSSKITWSLNEEDLDQLHEDVIKKHISYCKQVFEIVKIVSEKCFYIICESIMNPNISHIICYLLLEW